MIVYSTRRHIVREFQGRVAVITGASRGLGRGLALHAASEGMHVVAADVDEAGLASLAGELEASGTRVIVQPTDVRDPASVDALAQAALAAFGAVHLVFNNAGVMLGGVSWERTDDDWRWVLDVNLFGVINGVRTFLPILIEQGEPAHMVNTASIGGLLVGPFLAPYTVSKHAVVSLTESIHHELATLGTPVKISALCPGAVATGIADSERIRPADRSNSRPLESSAERAFDDAIKQGVAAGMSPQQAATIVFRGIREERFWIYTDESFVESFRARADSIAAGTNPSFAPEMAASMLDGE
jgi:NAD(P)-dependent dehydrogenase (short-subunit alcohol dehydrogenase family)